MTAADTRARFTTTGSDRTAIDGDGAACLIGAAADACLISFSRCGQLTHITAIGLGVNGQFIAVAHADALLSVQLAAVYQNQVNISGDSRAFGQDDVAANHIPAAAQRGRSRQ